MSACDASGSSSRERARGSGVVARGGEARRGCAAAHREVEAPVHPLARLPARLEAAQVEVAELVAELVLLHVLILLPVHRAHEVALCLEPAREVRGDEAASTSDDDLLRREVLRKLLLGERWQHHWPAKRDAGSTRARVRAGRTAARMPAQTCEAEVSTKTRAQGVGWRRGRCTPRKACPQVLRRRMFESEFLLSDIFAARVGHLARAPAARRPGRIAGTSPVRGFDPRVAPGESLPRELCAWLWTGWSCAGLRWAWHNVVMGANESTTPSASAVSALECDSRLWRRLGEGERAVRLSSRRHCRARTGPAGAPPRSPPPRSPGKEPSLCGARGASVHVEITPWVGWAGASAGRAAHMSGRRHAWRTAAFR